VIPPAERMAPLIRLPPMHEYILKKLSDEEFKTGIFRRINWNDKELAKFLIRIFSAPNRIRFGNLDKLASLVSSLSDYHDWIGIFVIDEVLEFIRLSLEANSAIFQQRIFSSIVYLGQLYNFNVCNTSTLFHILYLLITFDIPDPSIYPTDNLIICAQRTKWAIALINVVCEFFCSGSSKKKMDNFLHFLLRFYYECLEKWPEFADTIGDFPDDIQSSLNELLKVWRRDEKFPTNLEEAKQSVVNIEKQYKTKIEEIMSKFWKSINDEPEDKRRLNCIAEEGEDDDDEWDEEYEQTDGDEMERKKRIGGGQSHKNEDDEINKDVRSQSFDGDDDFVKVHTQNHELLPEDEDFMRDFDKLMAETLQTAPVALHGPITDLEVPPLARQKFDRKITFAQSYPAHETTSSIFTESTDANSLLPSKTTANDSFSPKVSKLRMALMTRTRGIKGNRTVLKAVNIGQSENMLDNWHQFHQDQKRNRQKMKEVTLAMSERIQQQQLEEQLEEANRRLNGVVRVTL